MKRNFMFSIPKLFMSLAVFLAFSAPAFSMPPMPPEDEDGQCMEEPCPPECGNNGDSNRPAKFENSKNSKDCKMDSKMKKKFEKMLKKLKITDEQKAKMDELMKSDMAQRTALKKQIREKRQAVDNELLKADYDKTVVDTLTKEIRQLSGDIVQIQIDGKIKMRNILTYEQFKQLEEDRIQMQEKMKEKMKKKMKKTGKMDNREE
ncbi:MAG: Spy/CpxP family protein refolding chaperone [Endomicrobiaceae bacterium]